ncbi:MAG: hypothetical protein ACLFPX_06205 [Candidatus Omnitrophota bacterium]
MFHDLDYVIRKLAWMREQQIWPNGQRYLWTDAFGLVLLISLYKDHSDERYLEEARLLVQEVERVLGRDKGIRIGEAEDRGGQYYHYLIMWIFALSRFGEIVPEYREKAVALVKDIHPAFVEPGTGVHWKMLEDLSAPWPGYGYGGMDYYDGYVIYRLLDPEALADEIAQMRDLVQQSYRTQYISQDLGIGMMLWLCHFFADEEWARIQRQRCLQTLDMMWIDPPGYFCRHPGLDSVKYAFTNYGVSLGLQSAGYDDGRLEKMHEFFDSYRSGEEYDVNAITHVMACTAHYPGEFIATVKMKGSRHADHQSRV